MTSPDIPDDFARHTRTRPLTEPWEPTCAERTDGAVVLGLRLAGPRRRAATP